MSEIHQLVKNKGYWKANDKYFDVKVNAILEAQSNDSEVTFHYNDQWWDQVDWTVEPNESLEELYLKRARDLRNKYKTLILRFSGGADSMNIIKTFVDNNIKIDVIIVNEYCELLNADRFVIPSSAEKIIITMPFIRELQKQGVEFEFLEVDNSILFPMLGDNVDWIFRFNMPRFLLVEFSSPRTVLHPKLQQYNNPDTCIISGVDKPQVWCRHNKIWTFEMPDVTQVLCDPGHSHIVQEPFYQSADLPELVVKQCHVIKSYMNTHADTIPVNNHNSYTQTLLVARGGPQMLSPDSLRESQEPIIVDHSTTTFKCTEEENKIKQIIWIHLENIPLLQSVPMSQVWAETQPPKLDKKKVHKDSRNRIE